MLRLEKKRKIFWKRWGREKEEQIRKRQGEKKNTLEKRWENKRKILGKDGLGGGGTYWKKIRGKKEPIGKSWEKRDISGKDVEKRGRYQEKIR